MKPSERILEILNTLRAKNNVKTEDRVDWYDTQALLIYLDEQYEQEQKNREELKSKLVD